MNTTFISSCLLTLFILLQLSCVSDTTNNNTTKQPLKQSNNTSTDAAVQCQLPLFNQYLNNLQKTDPASVNKAISYFQNHFQNCEPAIKDLGFVAIRDFYRTVHAKIHRHFHEEINDISIDNTKKVDTSNYNLYRQFAGIGELKPKTAIHPRIAPKLQALIENGFMIGIKGQRNTIDKNPNRLNKFLFNSLSPTMQLFLNTFMEESAIPSVDKDRKIVLPLAKIAKRIIDWEQFAKTKPHFTLNKELQTYNKKMLTIIMLGAEKTPAFNSKNNALNQQFKEAYQQIIKAHPHTNTGIILQKYYDILQANNFIKSTESAAILQEWKLL